MRGKDQGKNDRQNKVGRIRKEEANKHVLTI